MSVKCIDTLGNLLLYAMVFSLMHNLRDMKEKSRFLPTRAPQPHNKSKQVRHYVVYIFLVIHIYKHPRNGLYTGYILSRC